MKFRYRRSTINPNGNTDSTFKDFEQEKVVFGRGGNSDVLLQGKLVDAEHAEFFFRDEQLFVRDLDSSSGLLVNGITTAEKGLKANDEVSIGGFILKVTQESGLWGVHEEIDRRKLQKTSSAKELKPESLEVEAAVPRMRFVSAAALLLVLAGVVGLPLLSQNYDSWNAGPISNKHSMIGNDCQACHTEAFTTVRDKECIQCHELSGHPQSVPIGSEAVTLASVNEKSSGTAKKHHDSKFRCAECHFEHSGTEGLHLPAKERCVSCHASLDHEELGTEVLDVESFEKHPEFRVTLRELQDDGSATLRKVSLQKRGTEKLKDPGHIKLNHKLHLESGLRGPDGPEQLECADCHHFNEQRSLVTRISFDRDCRRCHPLGFDQRLSKLEVPHGDADTAFNFMYAEYAKLFLATEEEREEQGASPEFSLRRRPGYTPPVEAAQAEEMSTFTRDAILEEARKSETSLFEKTGCELCHTVTEQTIDESLQKSRFKVLPANIPERWMPDAIFDHGAHQELTCESCHTGVNTSEQTSDVLMPKKQVCLACHSDMGGVHENVPEFGTVRTVASDCQMCHSYHYPLALPDSKKMDLDPLIAKINKTSKKSG